MMRLTPAETVAAAAVLFFATAGVLVFALTLPLGVQFGLGMGWCVVLIAALSWLEQVRGGPDA